MQKRLQLLLALLAFVVTSAMAQITTSGISGKISSNGETLLGLQLLLHTSHLVLCIVL